MRKFDRLLFGTAGIPVMTKGDTIQGITDIKKLGLDAMEMEFVHSVNITEQKAPLVKKAATEQDVVLTCHAPYYINLNTPEPAKAKASMQRILHSARRTFECGGWSVAFHPGFYLGESPEKTFDLIKKRLKEILATLKDEGVEIWVRPETTGKGTQFGTLKELCMLSQEIDNVLPCIDFSHLHARSNGKENTLEEFKAQLALVEKILGKPALQNMHAHVAGIAYGEKGEKNHLKLQESDFNYKDLIKTWKEFKIQGTIICESPNIEQDALLLKKTYGK